jgi:phosphoribosylanthranilate isomerase
MRVRIKMCGVTMLADAMVAVDAGVDALGFIFHEQSPRSITPEQARHIIAALPPFVDAVGVFVDKKRREVEEIINYCRLNYAQLHGSETPKYCERVGRHSAPCQVIKAFRAGGGLSQADIDPYVNDVRGYLLDTYHKQIAGGTGETFDWEIIKQLNLKRTLILAGGLGPDNIMAALNEVRPYGIDVNSALEIEGKPGRKDHDLLRQLVYLVREFEQQV